MQFIYLNTKRQLLKRVLDLQEEVKDLRGAYSLAHSSYIKTFKEKSDQDEFIVKQEKEVERLEKKLMSLEFSMELRHQAKMQDKDDEIKHLQLQLKVARDAANGYKKAYNKLKEKETDFTVPQINADVWKMIRYKTFPETHKCTKECFVEHVLPAIQRDYDSINPKYKNSVGSKVYFIEYWKEKMKKEYDFIEALSLFCDKVIVHFKNSI